MKGTQEDTQSKRTSPSDLPRVGPSSTRVREAQTDKNLSIDPANRAPQLQSYNFELTVPVPVVKRSVTPGASSLAAAPPAPDVSRSTSPLLHPSLPALARYNPTLGSQPPSPSTRRTESRLSTYYTTAWGSPYATPSPRRLSSSIRSRRGNIIDFGLESPPNHSMQSGHPESSSRRNTTDLRDPDVPSSELSQQIYGSLGTRLEKDRLVRQRGKSIKDFTQDWINQYISGQLRSERTNWLSDDSGDDVASFLTAKNHLSESEGWLGLDDDPLEDDPLKTPTAGSFLSNRDFKNPASKLELPKLRSRHLKTSSTDTLKQSDFWDFGYDQDAVPATMPNTEPVEAAEPQSATRKPSLSKLPIEKPLPPPPDVNEASATLPLPASPKVAPTRKSTFQRPKKRVIWRGKPCVIALPLDDPRGTNEGVGALLTPADVKQRLQRWEENGYNVHIGPAASQSCPSFPDSSDCRKEWEEGRFSVSFPDQAVWDAYVNYLKEEKLRALGVSLGDDDLVSPMVQTPAQYLGNAVSPPIPTSSAASNHFNMAGNPLAAILSQTSKPNSNLLSLTSPSTPFGFAASSPFSNAPAAFSSEPGYPFLPYQSPANTAQGTLASQNIYGLRTGVVSPVGVTNLPNLGSMLQPVSPLTPDESQQYPGGYNAHPHLNHAFSGQTQSSQFRDASSILSPPLEDPGLDAEADSDTIQSSSGPEIAHPTPRGHRHNLSETLQRGVEHADFQLENSMRRQQHTNQAAHPHNDLMASRWAMPEEPAQQGFAQPNQQHHMVPQHLYGEQPQQHDGQLDGSEIDTNPSLLGTPTHESVQHHSFNSISQNGGASNFVPGHQTRTSISNLNIAAKAFDPTATFSPTSFSFMANNFQPAISKPNSLFSPGLSQHSATSDSFNANAPSFAMHSSRNSVSKNFGFSAASFNVEAPVFSPGQSGFADTARATPTQKEPRIFSSFDPAVIVPPAKESKAIRIVNPDEQKEEKKDEDIEDEDGRMGAQGRMKRARRSRDEGDQEISLPNITDISQQSQPIVAHSTEVSTNSLDSNVHATENASGTEGDSSHQRDEQIQDEFEAETEKSTSTPSDSTTWKPFEFKNEEDAAAFHAALPATSHPFGAKKAGVPTKEHTDSVDAAVGASTDKELPPVPQSSVEASQPSSVLKPTAKPFEFKPAAASFTLPAPTELPASEQKDSVSMEELSDVAESPLTSPIAEEASPEERSELLDDGSGTGNDSDNHARDSPDEEEIDAVMRQLNEDDSDLGVERMEPSPLEHIAVDKNIPEHQYGTPELAATILSRSNAPSPSIRDAQLMREALSRANTGFNTPTHVSFTPQRGSNLGFQSPVRQLNNPDIDHISDWDDGILSGQDEEFQQRARFFDTHVDEIIGGILDDRLLPLERTLDTIENSLALLASQTSTRRSASAEVEHSDADDEDEDDEESARLRSRSPFSRQNRLIGKIRQVVQESVAVHHQTPADIPQPLDLSEIHEALADLKTLTAHAASKEIPPVDFSEIHASLSVLKTLAASNSDQNEMSNLKADIVESIVNHPKLAEMIKISNGQKDAEKLQMQLEGLQSMLRLADERAEEEYNSRRKIQDSLDESQRLLKAAEEIAARYKDAALTAENELQEFKSQKLPELERLEKQSQLFDENQESIQLTLSELSHKNISLQGTLDEYRETGDQLRNNLDRVKSENKELRQTITLLKSQMEDALHARQGLRGKLDKLQDDMATLTRDVAQDQSSWKIKVEEQQTKYNILKAQYEDELKRRQKLELHLDDLEQKEKEATKLRFILGQSQEENAKLEELLMMVRQESHDYQSKAARYEREFNEARESSRAEIQRVRTSMESDLENANHQVNFVRAELESQINNLENQLESTRLDADTTKARYELLLEEANDAKRAALQEAAQSREMALQDQRLTHERTLNDLRERHARALHNGSEDRHREESHYMELLALRDEKVDLLQDKVAHLEEKLEIAKTAARTAALAAQNAKATQVMSPTQVTSPSLPLARGTGIPEKISPQALRESIMVLQDQLQQREGRIEELEQELSLLDKDAPAKIKEKETEITWLRELLHVRLDDLQDIINVLSQPSFNQNAVRDAAIRLKANLQMQQQEKERAATGGSPQPFPSLAAISTFAASPRALPLAAAAAWGNWRKGKENSTVSNIDSAPASAENTPSKTSNSQNFLSGLLTPPNSHMRQSPANRSAPPQRPYSDSRPLRSYGQNGRRPSTLQPVLTRGSMEPPKTPPLLRKSSYDHDAEATNFEEVYADDNESVISGLFTHGSGVGPNDGPFGPAIEG